MKKGTSLLIVASLALSVAATAQSQDSAPPRIHEARPESAVFVGAVTPKTEKATYLGVSTTSLPPALREQLKLQRGVGLVVAFTDPEGAAAAAGIQQHDVLVRLEDQLLVNAQQLAVLVRGYKPGDEVTLTLYRGGDELKQPVKLVEKELPVLEAQLDALGLRPPHVPLPPPLRDLPLRELDGVSIEWDDDEHRLILTDRQDQRWLHVEDRSGRTLFDGPVDTEQQRHALPDAIRAKLNKLETKPLPPVSSDSQQEQR